MALRVLIVDDSETTRRILSAIIRSRHWKVCGEAENGWSGVKKFQRLRPDVVLIDLAMPDINGIEAARWMSVADPTAALILFTVFDIDGLERSAQQAGIDVVLSKTQVWELVESIESAIKSKPSRRVN